MIDSWNAVPTVIKDTATITSFKRLYGAHRNNVDLATYAKIMKTSETSVLPMALYCSRRRLLNMYHVSCIDGHCYFKK